MDVKLLPLDQLRHAEYNPRQLSKKDFEQITKSISKFGFVEPIVVNSAPGREGVIVGGNQRFEVAKKLGHKNIPANIVNIPILEDEKELNVRLNRNMGDWDFDVLANEFEEKSLLEWGFEKKDLDFEVPEDVQDDEPPAPEKVARAQKGMIYSLGENRLMCGDSTKISDVEALIAGKAVAMSFCDPPYGVNFEYATYDDKKTKLQHMEFCAKWFAILKLKVEFIVITPGFGNEFIFYQLDPAFNNLVWYKKFAISASPIAFARVTEPVFVLGKPRIKRYDTDFFEYGTDREPGLHKEHPCPKPVNFVRALIEPQTVPGEYILDLFGGSGTTLIAAHHGGRHALLMEFDPIYCDVIIKRYCALAGADIEEVYASAKNGMARGEHGE